MEIRLERAEDRAAVGEVNRLAFGREDEGRLIDALRAEGYARLSLVAEVEGRIVGHILFSELPIATRRGEIDALTLAPMAVMPERQRQGVGSMLVREGLRACAERGHRIVIVLGHPATTLASASRRSWPNGWRLLFRAPLSWPWSCRREHWMR